MEREAERLMITVDEEELFGIMCDYTEVEHKVHNLLVVLNVLKDHYNGTTLNELYAIISTITYQVEMIHKEFGKIISHTDDFLLKN